MFTESEEEIFNPNCRAVNLLSNIKEKCRCSKGKLMRK